MSWRNKKGGEGEGSSSPESFSDLFQARPSEADRLSLEDLEICSARLRETLLHANEHLEHEIYSCVAPVAVRVRGPASLLLYDRLNGPWESGTVFEVQRPKAPQSTDPRELRFFEALVKDIPEVRLTAVPRRVFIVETQGPTSLLCGLPTVGAMPFLCAEHWYELRTYSPEKARRLRKEGRRVMKKG